jgi:uncharacterized iron-regulated membrane protein
MDQTAFYRTIWRWHFYAGLFVIPFVLILSVTGAFYLFKPQVERWEEQAWLDLPTAGTVSPDAQRDAALAAFHGARFHSYRLPRQEGDAAAIHLALPQGHAMRDVFVSPQGKVLGSLDPEARLMAIDQKIHGQLLLGKRGSWLVELAASWAIVMILTGLYLWWPRGRGLAGVVWPRLSGGKRGFLRDLHAVTGFWVAGLALVMLTTGLPWASAWGSALKAVRAEMGWVKGKQDWTIGGQAVDDGEHAGHDHAAMLAGSSAMPPGAHVMPDGSVMTMSPVSLSEMVARAKAEHLEFPVIVSPPGGKSAGWTVKSEAQNRPLRLSIQYDAMTGAPVSRETFADKHPIDRVVGYGVAWHEGQLFGWINQLFGVATALMMITLAVSGFLMWRRRRPAGLLGAPPLPPVPARIRGAALLILALAVLLPLLAASLILLWLVERVILRRLPFVANWLGIAAPA